MRFCIDCGARLLGAFCGRCGRPASDEVRSADLDAGSGGLDGSAARGEEDADRSVFYPPVVTDGRRCFACATWVAGAGRCASCGGLGDEVDDDVGFAAARAAATHVGAVDRASRGGPVRGFLSADEAAVKLVLVVLALLGVAVAVSSLAGFVFVLAVAVLALVPASVARGRGRQPLAWYVYGVLIFPLAVGHALMLPTLAEGAYDAAGDRQLRALVGGAAALFIALAVGLITNEVATSSTDGVDNEPCYELASQANSAAGAAEQASLLYAAADCLEGR